MKYLVLQCIFHQKIKEESYVILEVDSNLTNVHAH